MLHYVTTLRNTRCSKNSRETEFRLERMMSADGVGPWHAFKEYLGILTVIEKGLLTPGLLDY